MSFVLAPVRGSAVVVTVVPPVTVNGMLTNPGVPALLVPESSIVCRPADALAGTVNVPLTTPLALAVS